MLNQPFVTENPPCNPRNRNGNNHCEDESPGLTFHSVDEVHAEHRGHEGGNHHEDGHRGQRTHHGIHIVVDDTLIGVHRRFENVGVDAGSLTGLRHLNVDVFDKVCVELINLQLEL